MTRTRIALAGLLVVMGVLHFVVPRPFERIIPKALPAPLTLVHLSGLAELAAGGLLARARTARAGGHLAAAVFVLVFPGNIQMAIDQPNAFTLARLPLQIPLVLAALAVARAAPVGPRPEANPAELRSRTRP